jgi:hypothetical protein
MIASRSFGTMFQCAAAVAATQYVRTAADAAGAPASSTDAQAAASSATRQNQLT